MTSRFINKLKSNLNPQSAKGIYYNTRSKKIWYPILLGCLDF